MTSSLSTDSHLNRRRRWEARLPVELEMDSDQLGRMRVQKKRFNFKHVEKDIQDYNSRFIEILDELRYDVKNLGKNAHDVRQTLPNGQHYLKLLHDVGVEAYTLLPEGSPEYIAQLEVEEESRGISLDFTFPPSMSLLWELLYTGEPVDAIDKVNFENFWGYRYPIGRMYEDYDTRDRVKLQKGILASTHYKLSCSREELEQIEQKLRALREGLKLGVEFHRLEDLLSLNEITSDALLDHFHDSEFKYGVLHFACHCDNADPGKVGSGASRASLRLTAHQKELEMTVGVFNVRARSKRGLRNRPLVFLNACESSTPLHLQSLSLPTALINFGAGGVIATACTMPDNFASAFAAEFYSRLLDKYIDAAKAGDAALFEALNTPLSIGEALLEARRHFWETYKNPLGLAYGLYAQSNQQLLLPDDS